MIKQATNHLENHEHPPTLPNKGHPLPPKKQIIDLQQSLLWDLHQGMRVATLIYHFQSDLYGPIKVNKTGWRPSPLELIVR